MKGQNIPVLTISLFCISATLWGFTEQEVVTGLLSKDCILPCSFPPGNDVVIHWSKGGETVHTYYHQDDQPESNSDYINRTQLFHENIPSGNASLKLRNLTVTDEGIYRCYVGTVEEETEQEVTLHVRGTSDNIWKIELGVSVLVVMVVVVVVAAAAFYFQKRKKKKYLLHDSMTNENNTNAFETVDENNLMEDC